MYGINNVRKKGNLMLAYNQLITNPESTYKNYFRDLYNAYGLAIDENIEILAKKMKTGYIPSISQKIYMPKSNGLNRMYSLLTIEDQVVYQAYGNVIANAIVTPQVKQRYKKTVFGNLYSGKGNLFFYKKWQNSYKAYTQAILNGYKAGYNYIASFDLTACYDSINHNLLKKILIENKISENCAKGFAEMLEKWASVDGQYMGTGIPQGPQASGIIAEVVLAKYDEYIETLHKGNDFLCFRYVDDIKILAKTEENAKWLLFLIEKKSKELGLFPQASKITVHRIEDIDNEIKRISKPLFDDDIEEGLKSDQAEIMFKKLVKHKPMDITSLRRCLSVVIPNGRINKSVIKLATEYPNMVHSLAYYIKRYPRVIPRTIVNYIYDSCKNRTMQFAAGLLLESANNNYTENDKNRLSKLAYELLIENKREEFIVDIRFKAELILLMLNVEPDARKFKRYFLGEKSWWVKKELASRLNDYPIKRGVYVNIMSSYIKSEDSNVAIIATQKCIENGENNLFDINEISIYSQLILKRAGIIKRGKRDISQINKYLTMIVGNNIEKFNWKKYLGKEHNNLEQQMFFAQNYWKSDLTAFVNLWDTIDDMLYHQISLNHPELGKYNLGQVGSVSGNKKLKRHLPRFQKMFNRIHELRLTSNLSHAVIKDTNKYTHPISQKERKNISTMIIEGINDLIKYW